MTRNPISAPSSGNYVVGALLGAVVGVVAAMIYTRAAEEQRQAGGEPQSLQAAQIITIALALLGLIRQIAEMGRPTMKRRK